MIMAPVGTPPLIVDKLFNALTKVLSMPDVSERIVYGGANITLSKSPADAKSFISSELKKWSVVVKDSGATAD